MNEKKSLDTHTRNNYAFKLAGLFLVCAMHSLLCVTHDRQTLHSLSTHINVKQGCAEVWGERKKNTFKLPAEGAIERSSPGKKYITAVLS